MRTCAWAAVVRRDGRVGVGGSLAMPLPTGRGARARRASSSARDGSRHRRARHETRCRRGRHSHGGARRPAARVRSARDVRARAVSLAGLLRRDAVWAPRSSCTSTCGGATSTSSASFATTRIFASSSSPSRSCCAPSGLLYHDMVARYARDASAQGDARRVHHAGAAR